MLFWSGAGLSVDGPTNGPKGNTLTQRAIEEYMAPSTSGELVQLYRDLEIEHAEAWPRLETVLEALVNVHGPAGMSDVLSDLLDAPPNRHHRLMARHLAAAGGWHVRPTSTPASNERQARYRPPRSNGWSISMARSRRGGRSSRWVPGCA